ncbi:MAG: arginine--tRNA ligase [Parcubacteria group bacterium]
MAQQNLQDYVRAFLRDGIRHYTGQPFTNTVPVEHPVESRGDYASSVAFTLAKALKKKPDQVARELVAELTKHLTHHTATLAGFTARAGDFFETITAVGPFINIKLSKKFLGRLVGHIVKSAEEYGHAVLPEPKTVVVEYSGVNIGKPFGIGHLRSTVNGVAIANLLETQGYKVVRLNYLGDWGTQFGKLIAGYLHWGDERALVREPIAELQRVYVKFHDEVAKAPDEKLIDEAREWFRKLEAGDLKALKLWQRFRSASLVHANKIYALLETVFDEPEEGEAKYRDKTTAVLELLKKHGLLTKSKGAQIVNLEDVGLPPLLLQKTDEASLYATRELAAAIERHKKYAFSCMLYEVGQEQELHFKQVFAVLNKLGFGWAKDLEHIKHGLYRLKGRKMSTRAGRSADMLAILNEAVERASQVIAAKNPAIKNKKETARQVGIGAIKYNDLSQNRRHAIEFDFDRMLSLEGNSAPYLQYTHARIQSILRKAQIKPAELVELKVSRVDPDKLSQPQELILARRLVRYPEIVATAAQRRMPHLVATELFELASRFNLFYQVVPVLKAPQQERSNRLVLCAAVATVLKNGLGLLGIHAPDEM